MRQLSFFLSFVLLAASISTASAQYGLYGAPDTLNLQHMQPAGQPQSAGPAVTQPYSSAQTYPAGTPGAQVAPAAYQAMPVLSPPLVHSEPSGPTITAAQNQYVAPRYAAPAPAYGQMREEPMAETSAANSAPSNLVDSMVNQHNVYDRAYSGCGPAVTGCGEACPSVCAAPCNPWFGSVMALYMGRDHANGVWTTHQSTDEANQLYNTRMLKSDWKVGGEVTFGRRFCCDQWGLGLTYWTLDPFEAYAAIPRTVTSTVGTPLETMYVQFAGNAATDYFNGAAEHRLWRKDEVQNVEVNFFCYRPFYDCQSPWSVNFSAGVRYFRWSDQLRFGSLSDGYTWGEDGGSHEAYLQDRAINNLIGGQIGFDAGYTCGGKFRLFCSPKIGLYNNHIDNLFQLTRGDGVVADVGSSGVVGTYPVSASTNQVSFLTQVDVGLDWEFCSNWSARIGYRAVAATGMALADHQIPFYMVDVPEIASIKSNGNLLLHGAFVGITYNF